MLVKVRKYALPKKLYIALAYMYLLHKQLKWIVLSYAVLNIGTLLWPTWWWMLGSTLALVLYMLFWLLQFVGVTYLEQFKMLFRPLFYEIDHKQVLIRLNNKEGMPLDWKKIKYARLRRQGVALFVSPVQVFYLPFKNFRSDHDIKVLKSLLARKNVLSKK